MNSGVFRAYVEAFFKKMVYSLKLRMMTIFD